MLLRHFDAPLPQSMRQRVFVDLLQMALPMKTMSVETRLPDQIAEFVDVSKLHSTVFVRELPPRGTKCLTDYSLLWRLASMARSQLPIPSSRRRHHSCP